LENHNHGKKGKTNLQANMREQRNKGSVREQKKMVIMCPSQKTKKIKCSCHSKSFSYLLFNNLCDSLRFFYARGKRERGQNSVLVDLETIYCFLQAKRIEKNHNKIIDRREVSNSF